MEEAVDEAVEVDVEEAVAEAVDEAVAVAVEDAVAVAEFVTPEAVAVEDAVLVPEADIVAENDGVPEELDDCVGAGAQAGATPPDQAQLPSAALLARVVEELRPGAPQLKEYDAAPAVGIDGEEAASGQAKRGGCESATTSDAASARL